MKPFKAYTSRTQRRDQDKEAIEAKWSGKNGVRLAHPPSCKEIGQTERSHLRRLCIGRVCEIGCGTGRLAKHFRPEKYLGLDINNMALDAAEKTNPKHAFDLIMWESLYPSAETYLLYTVLMHIPDGEVFHIVKKLFGRVVVAESMGRWLRDYGRGNNFQRDPYEYRDLFKQIGMKEIEYIHCSTDHYPFYIDIMVFE